jgi:hypothetical protein
LNIKYIGRESVYAVITVDRIYVLYSKSEREREREREILTEKKIQVFILLKECIY